MYRILLTTIVLISFFSCITKQVISESYNPFEIKSDIIVEDVLELDSRYTIYPTAYIRTTGKGKLVIKEPIAIIGRNQVFSEDINIEFLPYTLSELNPEWFGAVGFDDQDDTNAFKKVFGIAREYYNCINIHLGIGKFIISETMEISTTQGWTKSINFIGESMSQHSQAGSSIIWKGSQDKSMFLIKNINLSRIENIDFLGLNGALHNIELRPNIYQLKILNCTFKGCLGQGSSNININKGNNIQVSEIQIENCTFHGLGDKMGNFVSESGISGGLANTKNFYIKNCSFTAYNVGAINIEISDIIVVENCTFARNEIDIICLLCNSMIKSNYSEASGAFFKATVSSNVSFTTLIGNFFDGDPKDGYVIRDGAGSLFLVNNNFGGTGPQGDLNNIKWDSSPFSSIMSFGNFYNNVDLNKTPFFDRINRNRENDVFSKGDIGGKNSDKRTIIKQN